MLPYSNILLHLHNAYMVQTFSILINTETLCFIYYLDDEQSGAIHWYAIKKFLISINLEIAL